MSLKWCDNANETVHKLFSDNDLEIDYVVLTLEGKTNMVLQEGHAGKGGRAKVEEILSIKDTDDKVMTGAFLASAVDERGGVTSARRKYIHFLWVGPSVGVMVKGRVNSFSGEFREKFPSCVLYLQLQLMGDLDQLEETHLERSLLACGGAHKPSRYSFTNRGLASAFTNSPIGKAMQEAAHQVQQGVERVQHVVADLVHSSHHSKKETPIKEEPKKEEEPEKTDEFAEDTTQEAAPEPTKEEEEPKEEVEETALSAASDASTESAPAAKDAVDDKKEEMSSVNTPEMASEIAPEADDKVDEEKAAPLSEEEPPKEDEKEVVAEEATPAKEEEESCKMMKENYKPANE